MMKCEFEAMVGKQVSFETFEMYQNMYMQCPDNVTKQDFVKMLNVDAIPEDPEAIERRNKKIAFVNEYLEKIERLKTTIKNNEETIKWYESLLNDLKDMSAESDADWYKREIKWHKDLIRKDKAKIKEYRFIIE